MSSPDDPDMMTDKKISLNKSATDKKEEEHPSVTHPPLSSSLPVKEKEEQTETSSARDELTVDDMLASLFSPIEGSQYQERSRRQYDSPDPVLQRDELAPAPPTEEAEISPGARLNELPLADPKQLPPPDMDPREASMIDWSEPSSKDKEVKQSSQPSEVQSKELVAESKQPKEKQTVIVDPKESSTERPISEADISSSLDPLPSNLPAIEQEAAATANDTPTPSNPHKNPLPAPNVPNTPKQPASPPSPVSPAPPAPPAVPKSSGQPAAAPPPAPPPPVVVAPVTPPPSQPGQHAAPNNNHPASPPAPAQNYQKDLPPSESGMLNIPPGGPPPRPVPQRPAKPVQNAQPPSKPTLSAGTDLGSLGRIGVFGEDSFAAHNAAIPIGQVLLICLISIWFIAFYRRP